MKWKQYEIAAMKRALALARRGRGSVEPNPMVGAAIVRNRRSIAGGYHHRFGGPHAEIDALEKAGRRARGAEMFVTLEPCSHFGKTPPCADAVIAAGIARVVVAMKDPFPLVAGRGIARLRKAGLEVDVGLLAGEARALNAPFVKLRTRGVPYVIAKYAMTADGNVAAASGDSRWISCPASRCLVHKLRGRVDAIVVGIETALKDDPLLTARPTGKRTPARVVLDSRARLPLDSALVKSARRVPLIVAVTKAAPRSRTKALSDRGAQVLVLPGIRRVSVAALARALGKREMTNILVEGGPRVLGSFFAAKLVDEMMIFVAPKLAGAGIPAVAGWSIARMGDAPALMDVRCEKSGRDLLIRGAVSYRKNG